MLTQDQVLEAVKNGRKSDAWIDARDYSRLCSFFPDDQLEVFGFKATGEERVPRPWALEEVLSQLKDDVAFGFEKALNQRGISAGLMHGVVLMWMWILEDPLEAEHRKGDAYPMYGLPLFKAVAVKYGFDNPIGDDSGSERKYGS